MVSKWSMPMINDYDVGNDTSADDDNRVESAQKCVDNWRISSRDP